MLSHNEGFYSVFTKRQLEQIIAASDHMPTLENLLNQLTKYTLEDVMQSTDASLSKARIHACQQLIDAAIQHDTVTHLYDGIFDDLMVSAANLYQSKDKKNESYIISGDFSNLFNCNKAIGKKRTNEIMAIIIDMYKQAFHNISPPPHLVYGSRSGGDEFRFIVIGIHDESIQAAIQSAREKIEDFVEKLGLDQIEHSKYPGNPVKCGVGAEVAYKKLPVEFPSYELESELDEVINKKKFEAGAKKAAKKLITVEDPATIANSTERLSHVDDVINKYKITDCPQQKAFPFPLPEDEIFPGSIINKRRNLVETKAGQLDMNNQQSIMFISILENIYDKKDEKTGLLRNRDFIASIDNFMIQAKHNNTPCAAIKMEAHNFSSLNEIFSHYGNDVIFRQMADITAKHLASPGTVCFSRGGGIISPIVSGKNAAQINQVLENIIDEFHREIGDKTIGEYCKEHKISYSAMALDRLHINENTSMNKIPSIRGFHAGSGFIVSMIDLRQSANFTEVLNTLDKLNEENKRLGLSLKTEDKAIDLSAKKRLLRPEPHDGSNFKDRIRLFKSERESADTPEGIRHDKAAAPAIKK